MADRVLACLQGIGDVARRARGRLPPTGPTGRAGGDSPEEPPAGLSTRPPERAADVTADPPGAIPGPPAPALTRRQQEVLFLLAEGSSNRRIGRVLHITEQTVKAHLHMIYHKLGAANRTEAVLIALQYGLAPDRAGSTGTAGSGTGGHGAREGGGREGEQAWRSVQTARSRNPLPRPPPAVLPVFYRALPMLRSRMFEVPS